MKRLPLVVLLLVLVSLSSVVAQAQTPPAAAPAASAAVPKPPAPPAVPGTKIATIDYVRVLQESTPGKAASLQHEKEIAPESAKIEKLAKEITELQTKRQNAKTDPERTAIDKEIQAKGTEGQRAQQDASLKSDELQQKLLPPIANMIDKAVDEYSKANGLALVVDPNPEPRNVIFANPAMDITNEIMRAVNAAYDKDPKLAAPLAPGAPAAAPKAP